MDKVMAILSIVGAVVVALPPFLHALRLFLKAIPGDPGDSAVGWLEDKSQWLASLVSKVMPGQPVAPKQ